MAKVDGSAGSGKVASFRELSPVLQEALVRQFRAGERAAGEILIAAHEGFIRLHVMRYRGSVEIDDALQVGREGFLEGVRRWQPERGAMLLCCALWIRQHVGRYRQNFGRTIRVPVHVLQRARSDADALARSGARAEAEQALFVTATMSLEQQVCGEQTVGERLADDQQPPENTLGDLRREQMMTWLVRAALAPLSPREQDIIRRRFMSDPEETLLEISAGYGVTKERIRQVEAAAIKKIRATLQMEAWESFEDWLEHAPFLMAEEPQVTRAAVIRRSSSRGTTMLRVAVAS